MRKYKLSRTDQVLQDEFYDDIAKQGVEFLEQIATDDPETRLLKMVKLRDCLWAVSWDEPRLDLLVADLDEMLNKIARVFRRQMVRELFAGTLAPEMARETLRVLQETVDRGLWPEAAQDLDEILGPDDLRGFGPPEAA